MNVGMSGEEEWGTINFGGAFPVGAAFEFAAVRLFEGGRAR